MTNVRFALACLWLLPALAQAATDTKPDPHSTPAAGSWLLTAGVPGAFVHVIRPWSAAVHTPVHFPEVRSQTKGAA